MSILVKRAQAIAHAAHDSIKQVRKYTNLPYWTHTDAVAQLVDQHVSHNELFKSYMIAAAHLHDVIEDVAPKNDVFDINLISDWFGKDVAHMVMGLTDIFTSEAFPNLNREERKRLERERLRNEWQQVQTIKVCDLIDNTKDIVANDPDFARVYLKEKYRLLLELTRVDEQLLAIAHQQISDAHAKLAILARENYQG